MTTGIYLAIGFCGAIILGALVISVRIYYADRGINE